MNQKIDCKYYPICDLTINLPQGTCGIEEFIVKCPRYLQYEVEFEGKEPLGELERRFKEGKIID
jgi:hypothetical protein